MKIPKQKQNKTINNFKLGELFSGPGGLALGATLGTLSTNHATYQITPTWANDFDYDSCVTYANNLINGQIDHVLCEDVKVLDISKLPTIDAFAYGFPCNDFSIVGEQKGFNGKYGPLYSYGIKVINTFKPKFFVAENVGGLNSANNGDALKQILEDLANSGNGYQITAHLYKAEEYGISQTRHRIIIVGIDKSYNKKFQVPAPTHIKNYVPVKNVLENIPTNATNNEIKNSSQIVTERLKLIKPGQNVWTATLPDYLKLNVKSAKLSQIYRRLDPTKPSYTITASGGGGTHGYHYDDPRALTNRERARIQSFPDDFIFSGKTESVRKQIGMAVPPMLAKIIFNSIFKTLANIEYEYIKPNIT